MCSRFVGLVLYSQSSNHLAVEWMHFVYFRGDEINIVSTKVIVYRQVVGSMGDVDNH